MNHYIILLFFVIFPSIAFAEYNDHRNRNIDSLESVLQSPDLSWRDRVSAHSSLMWGYLQIDGIRSINHGRKVLCLTENRDDGLIARSNAFRIIGQHAYAKCQYDSAKFYYDLALDVIDDMYDNKHYTQSDIDDLLSITYGTIGNLYNIQSMPTIAIDYYLKALEIFQRNDYKESTAILYYNVGELFLEMGNNEEASNYYNKSLQVGKQTGDSLIMAMPRGGLAMVLLNDGKYDDAMNEASMALEYYLAHFDEEKIGAADTYVTMARIAHKGYNDIKTAQSHLDKALAIFHDKSGDSPNAADALALQAELCLSRQEYAKCIEWCNASLDTNDEDIHHNIGVYKMLAEANAAMGNSTQAAHYIEALHDAMTQLSNKRHQSAISEMQVRYETERKEETIARMETNQRYIIFAAVVIVVIIITIMVFLWRINSQRRTILAVKAKLIGERDERQRLARDLHDRLGGMLTATKLKLEQNQTDEVRQMLSQTTDEMRRIAHHLLPDSLANNGLSVAIRDYCNVLPNVRFNCVGTPFRLDEHLEALCYMALHEIINNALKHADARHIIVQMVFNDKTFSACVSDDGRGFVVDNEHLGMGLANIRERIHAANGTLCITSEPNKGTEVLFEIKADNNISENQ
ncbi:MAG: tetratricopeptide repeat protein [Bacteroidales bacterium]|nr:tetratricopeptide repeat protein [Bacteroidales bacterium]